MHRAKAIFAFLLLAGCQNAANEEPESASSLEQNGKPPFFVGQWAAEEAMCADAAWQLTEAGLSTPGHVSCTFDQLDGSSGIYAVDATCTAEGPPARYQLKISYAQSARALLIEGGPFQPIGLAACE